MSKIDWASGVDQSDETDTQAESFVDRMNAVVAEGLQAKVMLWSKRFAAEDAPAVAQRIAELEPEVVVMAPELDFDTALAAATCLEQAAPHVPVLVTAEQSTSTLDRAMNAGARGVISPHASVDDIRNALNNAVTVARRRRAASPPPAPAPDEPASAHKMIPVLAAKGGAGKTTLATNLAVALARQFPGEVVLIDLDLQFGDTATALGLDPANTIADTAAMGDGLDATTLKAFLTPAATGLHVLCAPDHPGQADQMTPAHTRRVLQLLHSDFRYVVIDTAAGLDEMALEAIEVATDLVLLTSMDVPALRATVKELEALRLLGCDHIRSHLVLNRATSKVGLSIGDIEATLGRPIDVRVPSSRSVPTAMNHGTPLLEHDSRSPAAKAIGDLAAMLAGVDAPRSGFFKTRSSR